ncbi:energy-coupling factor ABC transporter ATP-binding protein [Paenibacillus sp. GCM10023248]|uniref:energy-coupling factor ABC transporter ATP-binding protein n=1 Tax=unclassified Paenibacillus TaxID=185978 RepID=UPI002379DA5E|nr:ATP-binding cassette domain-containing protein [Paenibacillus sp. MAHUQ-63]MDD9266914.1 ATP-binding cassette domain-containing protein [Paenibacillus sp. MAHUQ-63]
MAMKEEREVVASLHQAAVVYRTESGGGRRVWSNVDLNIYKGEWLMVIGPNGSGKSTLASVLLGLSPLSSGELLRNEARHIRGVLQLPDAQFVGDTIMEELDYLPAAQEMSEEERHAWYRESLSAVGLSLSLERQLATLSGGQKQLVNLAAALAVQPEILVLDEPTAMLDPASRKEVRQAVREAHKRGTTIVWITHRLEEAADATRIVGFSDGKITFDGEPRAFFYGENAGDLPVLTPCMEMGFDSPYVVKTAIGLLQQGCRLRRLPLGMEELAEAVMDACP